MTTTYAPYVTHGEYLDWLAAWGVDASKAVKEFSLSDDPDAPGNVLYGKVSA